MKKNLIDDWKKSKPGTIDIEWQEVEKFMGFALHENFKDFYSRIMVTGKGRRQDFDSIDGIMKFNPGEFVKEYASAEDNWLTDANAGKEFCGFTLRVLSRNSNDYVCKFVKEAFSGSWTGGNNFGHRAYIGEILLNTGQVSIIFNNDTGRFEWADFGYGYFDVYEENPYEIIADTAQEFLGKIEKMATAIPLALDGGLR